MDIPRVTVCVPTYNRANSLRRTINAIQAQTFEDWELIICDDASTDNTAEISKLFKDKRIKYYRNQHNLGLYGNWNKCLMLASGEFVAIYHDHDVYLPNIVEESVRALDRHRDAVLVHTASLIIDQKNDLIGVDIRPYQEITSGKNMMLNISGCSSSPIVAATAMVRKDAYKSAGFFNYKEYGIGCDMNMWFRLASLGDFAYLREPQVLIRNRNREDDTSQFRWSDLDGMINMRRIHIEEIFKKKHIILYLLNKSKYNLWKEVNISKLYLRAALLEPSSIVNEGKIFIENNGRFITKLFCKAMSKGYLTKIVASKIMLPYHYHRVEHLLELQKQGAQNYLRTNEFISNHVSKLYQTNGENNLD